MTESEARCRWLSATDWCILPFQIFILYSKQIKDNYISISMEIKQICKSQTKLNSDMVWQTAQFIPLLNLLTIQSSFIVMMFAHSNNIRVWTRLFGTGARDQLMIACKFNLIQEFKIKLKRCECISAPFKVLVIQLKAGPKTDVDAECWLCGPAVSTI